MSNIAAKKVGESEAAVWNDLLRSAVNGSYRQSLAFEYAHELEGKQVCGFLFNQGNTVVAGSHYLLKPLPFRSGPIADVGSGFVFREEPRADLFEDLISHLLEWAKVHDSPLVRVTTWLPKCVAGTPTPYSIWVPTLMKNMGFHESIPGRHTYWIDLTKDEDVLFAKMTKQARYNVRKAHRAGMTVDVYEHACQELVDTFFGVYDKRARQKGLDDRLEYQRIKREVLPMLESRLGFLAFARFRGRVCNVTFASNFGQAASIHSGINPDVLTDKSCPPPGHILRWEIIRNLKSRGLRIHDMGFCPGATPIEGHPRFGIWSFKHSFGGDPVEFLPTYERVVKPVTGHLLSLVARLRSKRFQWLAPLGGA